MEEIGGGGVAENVGGEKKRRGKKRKGEMDKSRKNDRGISVDLP
jgi:hypothetical protein